MKYVEKKFFFNEKIFFNYTNLFWLEEKCSDGKIFDGGNFNFNCQKLALRRTLNTKVGCLFEGFSEWSKKWEGKIYHDSFPV